MDNEASSVVTTTTSSLKRRGGNTARRRRAKRLAHQSQAEYAHAHANSSVKDDGSSNHCHNPPISNSLSLSCRSIPIPGALERRGEGLDLSKEDERTIVQQLGFLPGNAISVVGREDEMCKRLELEDHPSDVRNGAIFIKDDDWIPKTSDNVDVDVDVDVGAPTVLKLYPLALRTPHSGGKAGKKFKARKRGDSVRNRWTLDGNYIIEPFPTIYWLCNPKLRVLISKLEDSKEFSVKAMYDRLQSDENALKSMKLAHENYGKDRWNILTDTDREEILKRNWGHVLGTERGVAGMYKFSAVKCLHTHTAHYLAGETRNIIGKWTIDALKQQFLSNTHTKNEDKENEN